MPTRPKEQPETIDPVTVQVIRNAFVAAADEMKITMVKTAYNDLLYEVHDFGVVITNGDGDLLAQADTLPVFLSVLPGCVKAGIARYGKEGFCEGDVVLANDPYSTGTHISDTAIYIPVFHEGILVGFTTCMAHWADIGGKSPGGWCPDSTDIFQEGLRFNHIKLATEGRFDEALLSHILDNIRLPFVSKGDLGAQLAACRTGARRVRELYEKYGKVSVEKAIEIFFDQAEARMRAALAEIPDGEYSAETYLDHDGVDRTKELKIHLTVKIEGSSVLADFSGSSPTARGPVNCPFPAVVAAVETAIRGLTLPFDRTNAGHSRPIQVTAPRGTIVRPEFPAPVDSYGYVFQMASELVIRAFSQVLPEKCPAGSYPLFLIYFFRMARERSSGARSVSESSFVFVDPPVGGAGASASGDGASGLICLMDGDAPSPVGEMIESKYPLRLEKYALNPASAGKGKFRGGMGTIKVYRVLEDDLYSQVSIEGTHYPGWGLNGGHDAQPCAVIVHPGTDKETKIQDKVGFVGPFKAGDQVIAICGGGGGWGDPFERDPSLVREDVLNDFCTLESAKSNYGVILDPSSLNIDYVATQKLRNELRK